MKDFKNYTEEEAEKDFSSIAEGIAKEYKGKSEADVIKAIIAQAESERRKGNLSDEEVERFYENFSPMLNSVQKKKCRAIIDRIKKIPIST